MKRHGMTAARKRQARKVMHHTAKLQTLGTYIRQEYMDEDGFAVIDVRLYEGLEWYDPLSVGRQRDVNPEIIDFIERKAAIIPALIPLKIRFHGGGITQAEQQEICSLLDEHYAVVLQDKAWDQRINRRKMIGMLLVGVALLSLYFYFALTSENALFLEILSITGSFALWEAADCFFLERREIRTELLNAMQHQMQEVEFVQE